MNDHDRMKAYIAEQTALPVETIEAVLRAEDRFRHRGWRAPVDAAEESVKKALGRQDKNAVILDHLGDILQGRGRTAEAVESWQKALRGEDDEGELDRARVERKIRDAQSGLRAQQTP